jgi:hypothetical protein
VLDEKSKTWRFFWWEQGKRHSKQIGSYKTKTEAWNAAKPLRDAVEQQAVVNPAVPTVPTVNTLVEQYREEKMPKRFSTRYGYEQWLVNHILPKMARRLDHRSAAASC